MVSGAPAKLRNLFFGNELRQSDRALRSLLVVAVYGVLAGLQHAEVLLGLIDRNESNLLSAFNITGSLIFFAVVRSGYNLRLPFDPLLTLPQCVFGVVAMTWSYAITGPARGAVLTMLVLILVFAMFALEMRALRWLAAFAFGCLAMAMLWKSMTDPLRYPPRQELAHFLFAAIVVPAVALLSMRLAALRTRLREQKEKLSQALEQNRQLATLDELTGLANRRHMASLMQTERLRLLRTGREMTLALIDIDLFKVINDTYGHAGGDMVLRKFAAAARSALRESDVLARWGGEEFLLMLPETDPVAALLVVERVRVEVARTSFLEVDPALRVTFSAGLSACGCDGQLEAVIEGADRAMYEAKAQGRNCSVINSVESAVEPRVAADVADADTRGQ